MPTKLPLPNDIGAALIDYYKYGRPITPCNNVFVKHIAPYNEFRCMGRIIEKYIRISGLNIKDRVHGLHSLRHTLASRLLEKEIPITTIASILGHSNLSTVDDYLHIDIENLRKCTIDPYEVQHEQ